MTTPIVFRAFAARPRSTPVVASLIVLTLLVAGCGDTNDDTSDPEPMGDSVQLASIEDAAVAAGEAEFLVAGRVGHSTLGFQLVSGANGETTASDLHRVDAGARLADAIEVQPVDRGRWVIGAAACVTEADASCSSWELVLFVASSDGEAAQVASLAMPEASFNLIGAGEGHFTVEVVENQMLDAGQGPDESMPTRFVSTYHDVDLGTGRTSLWPWTPEPIDYDAVSRAGNPVQQRVACVAGSSLVILDGIPNGSIVIPEVTTVSAGPEAPSRVRIEIPSGEVPGWVLCDAEEGPSIVTFNHDEQQATVRRIAASGEVLGTESMTWEDDLRGVAPSRATVLVTTFAKSAPGEVNSAEAIEDIRQKPVRLYAYLDGGWRPLDVDLVQGEQAWLSDDGSTLLVRSANGYRTVRL